MTAPPLLGDRLAGTLCGGKSTAPEPMPLNTSLSCSLKNSSQASWPNHSISAMPMGRPDAEGLEVGLGPEAGCL
ncbi:hypothetical protein NB713_003949 [Xanthomonas sacchari]|nr:hypothetical protein [Xanthomonas sacchari]